MAIDPRYSTFRPRFWAGFIDGLILLPISLFDKYLSSPARAAMVLIAWAIFSNSAGWIYSVYLHAHYGQTVGKWTRKVKVMDVSEKRIPSLNQALLRDIGPVVFSCCFLVYFIYLVVSKEYNGQASLETHWPTKAVGYAYLAWFLIEITTMLTNSKRRAFHDLIAGTVVVRVG